ncbi:hypothetical protein [Cysteiniphilum sp. 6C5]|uniref:hypothetical protein n=1 Tax=unclassified Cysteiniphilum TaxID=2610889 RepID=UPI003F871D29
MFGIGGWIGKKLDQGMRGVMHPIRLIQNPRKVLSEDWQKLKDLPRHLTEDITGERRARIEAEGIAELLRNDITKLNALGSQSHTLSGDLQNLMQQMQQEEFLGRNTIDRLSQDLQREANNANKLIGNKETYFANEREKQINLLKDLQHSLPELSQHQEKLKNFDSKRQKILPEFQQFEEAFKAIQGKGQYAGELGKQYDAQKAQVKASRDKLEGLFQDDDPKAFREHALQFQDLLKFRGQASSELKKIQSENDSAYPELQLKHANLSKALNDLLPEYEHLKAEDTNIREASKLQARIKDIEQQHSRFKDEELPLLKQNAQAKQGKLKEALEQLSTSLTGKKAQMEEKNALLQSLQQQGADLHSSIQSNQQRLEGAISKHKNRAQMGALLGAAIVALATWGAGAALGGGAAAGASGGGALSSLGSSAAASTASTSSLAGFGSALSSLGSSAITYAPLITGLAQFQNHMGHIGKVTEKLSDQQQAAFEAIGLDPSVMDLANYKINDLKNIDYVKGLRHIEKLEDVYKSKVPIPELGNMRQSLQHFGLPTLPKLDDLPNLNSTLGRVAESPEYLGVPKVSSMLAKKFGNLAYLNPDLLKVVNKAYRKR